MAVVTRRPEAAPPDTATDTQIDRPLVAEAVRLAAIERRLLHVIQWVVFGGVILLTVGAGALSWEHLTHIAATNGHIAPRHVLFLFPTIVDGFMVLSSGVVVRHALTDELGRRTWYAGILAAATASLSVCLNIQDSTRHEIVPGWLLPGIAPALYMLGTELGLAELRLLMRKLRSRIRSFGLPVEPTAPSQKEIVLSALAQTGGHVPTALEVLAHRGVTVDRSYVYEIKRSARGDHGLASIRFILRLAGRFAARSAPAATTWAFPHAPPPAARKCPARPSWPPPPLPSIILIQGDLAAARAVSTGVA